MAKLAIDKSGQEWIYDQDDTRNDGKNYNFIPLPSGTIERLIGRQLKTSEMPVELVLKKHK